MLAEISVIMSAYNAASYLLESITSILNQQGVDLELIIINDGSTDSTSSILDQIEKKDKRVKIVNQENKGLAESLNLAISISKGKYIARMDADDIAHPKRLLVQLNFLNSFKDIDIVGSYVKAFGDSKVRTWKYPLNKSECDVALLFLNPLAHPAVMFRKSVINNIGFYDLSYNYDQDYELWARASHSHGIANIPSNLLNYRIHKDQMGSIFSKSQRVESQKRTQLSLLKIMGLNPSEEDMEIQLILSNAYRLEFEIECSGDLLEKISKWIKEIVEKNNTIKRYNDFALRHRLHTQYHALCLYSASIGLSVFSKYKDTAVYLQVNSFNLPLFISCFLKLGRKEHIAIYNRVNQFKGLLKHVFN